MRALIACAAVLCVLTVSIAIGDMRARTHVEAIADRSMAAQRDATRRAVGASVDEAVEVLARETAAEPAILRRIVAGPFERRGLLP